MFVGSYFLGTHTIMFVYYCTSRIPLWPCMYYTAGGNFNVIEIGEVFIGGIYNNSKSFFCQHKNVIQRLW